MAYLKSFLGVEETQSEFIVDLDEMVKVWKNNAKMAIIIGAIAIFIAGLGLIAIIIGIVYMVMSPDQIFNMNIRFVESESRKKGKPIVYRNLTPSLQARYQSGPPVQAYPSQAYTPPSPINPPVVPTSSQPSEDSMFCRFCGASVKKTSKFCNKCGSPL